jgi:hypothetical protein
MPSSLTFDSTSSFRNKLMAKNLKPYTVPGAYTPPANDVNYVTVLSDYSVIDSPDEFISQDPFADKLYPLNAYGPEGGFLKIIDAGGLANTKSNLGPYDYSDNKLPQISEPIQRDIPTFNKYAPQNKIQLVTIGNIQSIPTFKQYSDPLSFVPSSYSPYQILLQDNPTGDNGSLSQDSFIAQLGSRVLKKEFQERIGREIIQNTVGRVNLPNAVGDPVQAIQILQGKRPLVERDWVITRPSNIAIAAADFAARLGGFYFPGSVIPGEYFSQPQNNLSLFGQIAGAFSDGRDPRVTTDDQGVQRATGVGKLFGRAFTQDSPSQNFIDNTGGGQKSQLYFNLSLNRYSPNYERSIVGEIVDTARRAINSILDQPNVGGYYIGNKQLEASRIDSPNDALALDPFGRNIIAPMYGPDKLGKQYEGPDKRFEFGLAGKSITDNGGDLTGGFAWTSPKYTSDNIKPPFNSTSFDFKNSSILDYTQRFVTSADDLNGPNRFSHVGNAINQVSTIFNDGYKTMTKGSQIQKWSNPAKGVYTNDNIYCRVFTKDKPYFTFSNLQKTDGNIRKFSYSVLDNTYNLNIAPLKNPGSTNIVDGKVKKYMFSIENLAWRTSNRAGLTYDDLPECEKGPNGGRIMWFPPYGLTFNESSKPSFASTSFLGRPEPIFAYKDTTRSGSLSFKIIVDHPSILNLIVNKELANQQTTSVNEIVDSFIAGCLKYDIYELAKRWNTLSRSQLVDLQKKIVQAKSDEYKELIKTENVVKTIPTEEKVTIPAPSFDFSTCLDIGFYFANDIPKGDNENFKNLYDSYISNSDYLGNTTAKTFIEQTVVYNYDLINKDLVDKIKQYFETFPKENSSVKPRITIELIASASAPASVDYNYSLSQRRANSVKAYLDSLFPDFTSSIVITLTPKGEEIQIPTIKTKGQNIQNVNITCSGETPTHLNDRLYSLSAMACRRVSIKSIDFEKAQPRTETKKGSITRDTPETRTDLIPLPAKPATVTIEEKFKEGIGKRILRSLLTECDYFELIKETDPFVYDSMKQKIKYFNPAFHSMTPEGLNSRLTFLHQCTRPGDTIPVIDINGRPKYNNAVNTAFGAPPVLILRIGDFFHTKIIPGDVSFSYEEGGGIQYDLNPEGIGVQPMIVKVQMNFTIVGGMGLKEPIQQLQNALSFNYYANTEVYDERAEWTDDSFKQVDEKLIEELFSQVDPPTTLDKQNNLQNQGGDTIGTILTRVTTESSGTTGDTSYKKIMDSLYDTGQEYLNTVMNKFEELSKNYNNQILQTFTQKNNYSDGKTSEFVGPFSMNILGKSNDFQSRLKEIKDDVVRGIKDRSVFLMTRLDPFRFKNTDLKKVENRLIRAVEDEYLSKSSAIETLSQTLVQIQQNLVIIFSKLDFVITEKDGYITPSQEVKVFKIKSTSETFNNEFPNTLDELKSDYKKASEKLLEFYNLTKDNKFINYEVDYVEENTDVDLDGNTLDTVIDRKFYVLMSNIIINDNSRNKLISDLDLPGDQLSENGQELGEQMKIGVNDLYDDYKTQKENQDKKFNELKDKWDKSSYKTWNVFVKGKERKFTYNESEEGNNTDKDRLKNIYKKGNSNNNKKTFNGKTIFL